MNKKDKILQEYDNESKLYETFSNKVRQLIEEIINDENISCNAITCRLKSKESLSKKIDLKQNKYSCLGDLTDISGVRVITYYSDDVDKIIHLVEKEFKVDRKNSIDKRKALGSDRFGYCSVHYIVGFTPTRLQLREYQPYKGLKCEIQIRTVLQHAWAEIEHDLGYKSALTIPEEIRRNFSRLAGLLEIGDKEFLEIRNYLKSYSTQIAQKINDKKLDNNKLDAIMLNEFVSTDPDIIEMNIQITKCFNFESYKLSSDLEMSEYSIKQLAWFNVTTLGELKKMLNNNKFIAIQIADKISKLDKDDDEFLDFDSTTAVFYLCYAELLKQYDDEASIQRYFNDQQIFATTDFCSKLLNIKKQLYL